MIGSENTRYCLIPLKTYPFSCLHNSTDNTTEELRRASSMNSASIICVWYGSGQMYESTNNLFSAKTLAPILTHKFYYISYNYFLLK